MIDSNKKLPFAQLVPDDQERLVDTRLKECLHKTKPRWKGELISDILEKELKTIGMDWLEYEMFTQNRLWVHHTTIDPVEWDTDKKNTLLNILQALQSVWEIKQEATDFLKRLEELSSILETQHLFVLNNNGEKYYHLNTFEFGSEISNWEATEVASKLKRLEVYTNTYGGLKMKVSPKQYLLKLKFHPEKTSEELEDLLIDLVHELSSLFYPIGEFLGEKVNEIILGMKTISATIPVVRLTLNQMIQKAYLEKIDGFTHIYVNENSDQNQEKAFAEIN